MSDTFQSAGDSRTTERRYSPRQRVSFACIQLDDEHNGGLILDVSERGLSVQAVSILTPEESPSMRFQLSPSEPWIETRGRIAWIGASMKRAGLEFIDLPDDARDQIRRWISLELRTNKSAEETTLETTELPTDEPENVISFPEPETMRPVAENQNLHSIADDAVEATPNVEKVIRYSRPPSTAVSVTGNARDTATPPLAWSELESRVNREIYAHTRMGFPRTSGRLIGFAAGALVLGSAVFFLAYHLQKSKNSQQHVDALTAEKAPEPSTPPSTNPAMPPIEATAPAGPPDFMLQVGALTHKENADALAEDLHRRDFPTFVSPPGTDRFYRVFVGPFRDPASTLRAKEELKEKGFESIERRGNR